MSEIRDRLTKLRQQEQETRGYGTSSAWYTALRPAISYLELAETATNPAEKFRNAWNAVYNLSMMMHRRGEIENVTFTHLITEVEAAPKVRSIALATRTAFLEALKKAQTTLLFDAESKKPRESKQLVEIWLDRRKKRGDISPEKACTYLFLIGRDLRNALSHPKLDPNSPVIKRALAQAADIFVPLAIATTEAMIERPPEGTTGRVIAYRSFLYPFLKNSDSPFSDYYLERLFPEQELSAFPEAEGKASLKEINQELEARRKELVRADADETLQRWCVPVLFQKLGLTVDSDVKIVADDGVFEPTAVIKKADLQGRPRHEYKAKEAGRDLACLIWVLPWSVSLDAVSRDEQFESLTMLEVAQRALNRADVDWAIITNGQQVRLLSKTTSHKARSFMEIDLVAIVERRGEREAQLAFRYLLGLCSQASIVERDTQGHTRLERALRESERHGRQISDELKKNVFSALEELGEGFLAYMQSQPDELDAWRARRAPSLSAKEFLASQELLTDIYQESLSLMYRLLFLFYAESRDLLPMDEALYRDSYSLESIRDDIIATHDDPSPTSFFSPAEFNLWNRLAQLSVLVNEGFRIPDGKGGWQEIVPAYNGGLFDPEQHEFLERFKINDYQLANAIDLLSRTKPGTVRGEGRKKVTYRDLDIRHLGSIYEGILEYHAEIAEQEKVVIKRGGSGKTAEDYVNVSDLKVDERPHLKDYKQALEEDEENPSPPRGCKITGLIEPGEYYLIYGGRESKRKSSGSYYTPHYIVQYIVENTLGPWVRGKCRLNSKGSEEPSPLSSDEILELKVLDPAMGSGHFLVAATEFIAIAYGTACIREGKDSDGVMSEEEFVRYKRMIAERCIYGVDINPMAVELAKLSMWLFTMDKGRPLSFLNHHLKCGNALIGAWIEGLGAATEFDRYGNPKRRESSNEVSLDPKLMKQWGFDPNNADDRKVFKRKFAAGRQRNVFEDRFKEKVPLMVRDLLGIMGQETLTINDVKVKKTLDRTVEEIKQPFRNLADTWVGLYFGDKAENYNSLLLDVEKARNRKSAFLMDHQFFHWELEFPEIWFDSNGQVAENAGLSALITNPPFKATKQIPAKERGFFWTVDGELLADELDYFELLWIKCRKLLKTTGTFGFVTPSSYLSAKSFRHLRKWLLSEAGVQSIVEFPYRYWPFEDVNTETAITLGGNAAALNEHFSVYRVLKEHIEREPSINERSLLSRIRKEDCLDRPGSIIALGANDLTSKIERNSPYRLGDIANSHKGWMSIPKSTSTAKLLYKKELFTIEELDSDLELKTLCSPILRGDDVQRHYLRTLTKATLQLYVNASDMDKKTRVWQTTPKIILQRITGQSKMRLVPFADTEGKYVVHPSANLVVPKHSGADHLLALAAVLGSKVVNYYYKRFFGETNTNIPTELLDFLPIPDISSYESELAKRVRDLVQENITCMQTVNEFCLPADGPYSEAQKQLFKFATVQDAARAFDLGSADRRLAKAYERSRSAYLKRTILEREINNIVYDLFEVHDEERAQVEFECSKLISGKPSEEDLL